MWFNIKQLLRGYLVEVLLIVSTVVFFLWAWSSVQDWKEDTKNEIRNTIIESQKEAVEEKVEVAEELSTESTQRIKEITEINELLVQRLKEEIKGRSLEAQHKNRALDNLGKARLNENQKTITRECGRAIDFYNRLRESAKN